jgi:membrane protein DedA with SNARE-associated domain
VDSLLYWLVENGSYGIMLLALLAAGLGVPLPEDIVLLAAGVLIHRGVTTWQTTVAVCFVGVLLGDLTIFLIARRLGATALSRRFYARLLPEGRRQKVEHMFARYGGGVVFLARHVAGFRAPVFALAGIHRMRVHTFLLFDALALCISAPLMIGLGYFFSDRLDQALQDLAHARRFALLLVGAVLLLFLGYRLLRRLLLRED